MAIRAPQYRMTLNFPDQASLDLFSNYARAQAAKTVGMTATSWIVSDIQERHGLVGDDLFTKWTVIPLYRGDLSMRDALASEFAQYAAGINWEAASPGGKPLVEFARRIATHWRLRLPHDAASKPHFLSCLESVADKVWAESGNDPDVVYGLSNPGQFGKALVMECRGDISEPLINPIDYVLDNWDALGNYTYTYRMLTSLFSDSDGWRDVVFDSRGNVAEMLHSQDVSECRDEMISAIKDVRKNW